MVRFVAGIILLALGQALVRAAYSAIGRQGVFYGSKLLGDKRSAETIRSVGSGFGGVLYKPHYVGTVLSLWAVVLLLGPLLPPNAWFVASFCSLLYSITAMMEDVL